MPVQMNEKTVHQRNNLCPDSFCRSVCFFSICSFFHVQDYFPASLSLLLLARSFRHFYLLWGDEAVKMPIFAASNLFRKCAGIRFSFGYL